MYKFLIRPILFILSPEAIHCILTRTIKYLFYIPGVYLLLKRLYSINDSLLETEFLGHTFLNPVGLAAGFDKNGEVFKEFSAFGFSHIELGTVTPSAQPGNPKPRSFRLPEDKALVNRMGFNNRGVEELSRRLQRKRRSGLILGGNIGKNTLTPNDGAVEDYKACFSALYGLVDYFVVNVSCPNISDLYELQDQDGLERILGSLAKLRYEKEKYIPILLKISPDLNEKQIDTSLEIVAKYGIDGIVATNTTISRSGLKTSAERISRIGNGGLSGAPITQRSLEVVRYIAQKTDGKLPIIAVGGIMNVRDALNMLDAGARLLQIYTGFIYNGPAFAKRINKAILKRRKAGNMPD